MAHKADVNAADSFGKTPLTRACEEHTASAVVGLLLQRGANVNAPDRAGCTALMSAIPALSVEIVKILLAAGADVNVKNAAGETALSMLDRLFAMRPKLKVRSFAERFEKDDVEIRTLLISAGAVR